MEATEQVKIASLTQAMREFLQQPHREVTEKLPIESCDEIRSIYGLASDEGLTLEDYVATYGERAIRTAQKIVADWENIMAYAVMNGRIKGENGEITVTRQVVQLIEKAVNNARLDLDMVLWLAGCGSPEQMRRDRLIQVLYNKGVKGDVKAIQYYIDRVDGKIGDGKGDDEFSHDNEYAVFKIIHTLFEKQLEVLNSGPGTKIICCSRRSGKTRLAAATLLIHALRKPNTICMYISRTMQLGEDALLGPNMEELITICDLKDSKGRRLNWKHLENGSQIIVRGLSNTKDPDAIRGPKAKVIVVDEFFHLNSDLLDYLFNEVLKPMQLDYAGDYVQILIGTPPRIRGTYGEKAWNTLDVPHFAWTARDNPYIKNFDEFVDQECKEKGVDRGHPYIRREYFGEWAYDEDALLYPEYKTWDVNDVVPHLDIDRVLCGLDYGTSDNDAVVGIAWSTRQRRGFVFSEDKFNRLTTPKDVTQFEYLKEKVRSLWEFALDFWPYQGDFSDEKSKEAHYHEINKRITWAADSSDGHLTEELQYNLHCKYKNLTLNIGTAYKHNKILMQDKIRDLLRSGGLLLPVDGKTARECDMTVLKRDMQGNILLDVDDKVFHPDLLPALRYALYPAIGEEVLANG